MVPRGAWPCKCSCVAARDTQTLSWGILVSRELARLACHTVDKCCNLCAVAGCDAGNNSTIPLRCAATSVLAVMLAILWCLKMPRRNSVVCPAATKWMYTFSTAVAQTCKSSNVSVAMCCLLLLVLFVYLFLWPLPAASCRFQTLWECAKKRFWTSVLSQCCYVSLQNMFILFCQSDIHIQLLDIVSQTISLWLLLVSKLYTALQPLTGQCQLVTCKSSMHACTTASRLSFVSCCWLLQMHDAQCKACKHMRLIQGTFHDKMVLAMLAVPAWSLPMLQMTVDDQYLQLMYVCVTIVRLSCFQFWGSLHISVSWAVLDINVQCCNL